MKPLLFGVFENAQANDSGTALWRHPDHDRVHFDTLDYWKNIAAICEQGGVDFLFLADAWGWSEIAGTRRDICDRESLDLPRLDPAIIIAALIDATSHLGLVMTGSTLVEAPYSFARRLATLDHLSRGRIGWNVVTTGTAETAVSAFGQSMVAHDDRYDMADDFMDLAYKLFEGGWAPDAIERDRAGRFSDPAKVHRIVHDGPYFKCNGYGNAHYSPQGTPVIFQAGSSPRGLKFAGRHGECVFLGGGSDEDVSNQVRTIRQQAQACGRDSEQDIKILCAFTCVIGSDENDAREKHRAISQSQTLDAAAASYAMFTGLDLTSYPGSTKMNALSTELSQTQLNRLGDMTVEEVLSSWLENGVRPPPVLGSASQIVEHLQTRVAQTGIDGFLFAPTIQPSSTEDFVREILPEFRRTTGTMQQPGALLRQRMMGTESPYLVDRHRGARFRPATATTI
ncbi:MAG: NtaA/DmoA family FMN-dependent monooxygenase [Pseudomonadota bacterium]